MSYLVSLLFLLCYCIDYRTEQNLAQCITTASGRQRTGKIKMKFDRGDRTFEKSLFEYVDDPTIESAESGVTTGQVN